MAKDKPTGLRMKLQGMAPERLDEKPKVGKEYIGTIRMRVKGFHTEEMATDGMREDVILKVLSLELGEEVAPLPNDPNQTSIDDAPGADGDAGDFTG